MRNLSEGMQISEKLLGSDIKTEILALFHKNPGLVDSIDGVSRRIGRTAPETMADFKDLISVGVLLSKTIGGSEVIYFDRKRDTEIQKAISNLLRMRASP